MKNERARKRLWMVCLAGLAAMLVVFAASAGKVLVVDEPERSDVIVVLAGETDRRPAHALELLDRGYGKRVVLDVPAAARIYGISEVQIAEEYVRSLRQAASLEVCPIEGLSTWAESHDAEKCLHGDESRVLIVTSDFHTRRALYIFRHELHGRSFSIAAARDETQFGTRWWMHRQWAKTYVDEWLRMIWWTLIDQWR